VPTVFEIWEPQPSGTLWACYQACNGIALPLPYTTIITQMLVSDHHQHVLHKAEPYDAAANQV